MGLQTGADVQATGDYIVTGNIERSYAAIGSGAQVIVNQALSRAQELEGQQQLAEQRLAAAIQSKAQRFALLSSTAAQERGAGRANPYRSLLNYRVEDSHLFFGRAPAIAALLGRLRSFPLTILHAESGAGKTSLLEAGVAARLIANSDLPLLVRARKRAPVLAIKQELLPGIESDPALAPLAAAPLPAFLSLVCQQIGTHRLYILLDQFEEFFVEQTPAQQEAFAQELGQCIADSSLNAHWILALRKEYFSDLEKLRPHVSNPFVSQVRLAPFTAGEAHTIITAPEAAAGVHYGPGLPEQIIAELLGAAGEEQELILPPQLQIVCFSLFESLGEQETVITLDHYKQLGCAAGLLRNHLQDVLNHNLPDVLRPKTIRLLDLLVDSNGRRVARSLPALQKLLIGAKFAEDELERILTELRESRLLRFWDEGEAGFLFELAHDYLAAQIRQSPEAKARKAAAELLERELSNWAQAGALMRRETLRVMGAQRQELRFTPEELELLIKSALEHGEDAAGWLAAAPPQQAQQLLAAALLDPRGEQRLRAIGLASPYLDQALRGQLARVAGSDPLPAVSAAAIQTLLQVDPPAAHAALRVLPFNRQAQTYGELAALGVKLPWPLRWRMAPARLVAYLGREWGEHPAWLLTRVALLFLLYVAFAWWQGLPPFVRWEPVPGVPREEMSVLARTPERLYVGSNNHGLGYLDVAGGLVWMGWRAQGLPTGKPANYDDASSAVLPISALVVNQADPQQLYIFIRKYGFMRSDDGGQSWRDLAALSAAIPTQEVTLTVSLAAWDRYVVVATTSHGLYGSGDHGDSWARLDDGADLPVGAYAMAQFDRSGRLYVSTNEDLYSAEVGDPWPWRHMQDVGVRFIEFSPSGERAFLAIGWPTATIVACLDASAGLGQLINYHDNIVTAIAADPGADDRFFVAAYGAETQSVTCAGQRHGLGQQSFLSFVTDLLMVPEDGYLYQSTYSGLYRRQP